MLVRSCRRCRSPSSANRRTPPGKAAHGVGTASMFLPVHRPCRSGVEMLISAATGLDSSLANSLALRLAVAAAGWAEASGACAARAARARLSAAFTAALTARDFIASPSQSPWRRSAGTLRRAHSCRPARDARRRPAAAGRCRAHRHRRAHRVPGGRRSCLP